MEGRKVDVRTRRTGTNGPRRDMEDKYEQRQKGDRGKYVDKDKRNMTR